MADVLNSEVHMNGYPDLESDESESEVECWLAEKPKSSMSQDVIEISSDSDCCKDDESDIECWLIPRDSRPSGVAQQYIYVDSD